MAPSCLSAAAVLACLLCFFSSATVAFLAPGPAVAAVGQRVVASAAAGRGAGGATRPASFLRMSGEDAAAEEVKSVSAQDFSKGIAHPKTVAALEDIAKVLPHRYPFALVDKIIHFEEGKKAIGVKCITNNEPQFTGHFPDRPIMPGVMQIEAMAQVGGFVCLQQPISDGQGIFFFAGVNGVRWRKPVVPGDVLVMEMELVSWNEGFGLAKMKGTGYVDGKVAVDVKEFTFALAKDA